jgi:hypothetical protein
MLPMHLKDFAEHFTFEHEVLGASIPKTTNLLKALKRDNTHVERGHICHIL